MSATHRHSALRDGDPAYAPAAIPEVMPGTISNSILRRGG